MSDKSNVWVFIEQSDGKVAEVSAELLCKARELADKLKTDVQGVLIGGQDISKEAKALYAYKCDEIFVVENPKLQHYQPIPYAKIMIDLIKKNKPEIVLYGATITGRDLAPRVASNLRVGLTADCTDLQIGDHITRKEEFHDILFQIRPAFGGNIIATIVSPEFRPQMATVREGVMKLNEQVKGYKGKTTLLDFKLEDSDFPTEFIERIKHEKKVNLKGAQIIVAGGMGVGSQEDFNLIYELAHTLGGEVAASRAAVDAGFISHDHQVGQTGTTVRPKLYIACGISGQIQHRAGMSESAKIIAINSDPDAPIFGIANYGIVGDLKNVIPKIIKDYKAKA